MSLLSYQTMTADDKIIKSIVFLNRQYPFFARIMLALHRHKVDSNSPIKTMAINQYGHLYFNEEFVDSLSFTELQAVLAHECCHVAFLTFQRQKSRDHELWNIATDIAINWILVESGMTLPTGCLIPSQSGIMELPMADLTINVKDISAEKIYELLEKQAKKVKANYKPFDSHLPGDEDGEGNSEEGSNTSSDQQQNDQKWRQVCANASAVAKSQKKLSNGIERILDGILKPKLNWKEVLNRYITRELPFNYSYSRPSKKSFSTGFYMPHVLKENLSVVVTCDVSGSISDKEYKDFMTEVIGICTAFEQVNARVIFWSTQVFAEDDILVTRDNARTLLDYSAKSTGGTTMSCVAEYMEHAGIQSRLIIHLTDGCVEGNPRLPDGVNICVISADGSPDILEKTGAIMCSLNDDGE